MLPRVVVTIAVNDLSAARSDCLRVPATAYAVELRCDFYDGIVVEDIAGLMALIHVPCIITLRPTRQGGAYTGSEEARLSLLESVLTLQPDYMDIEHDVSDELIEHFSDLSSHTRFIRSYHDMTGSPADLSAILSSMHHSNVALYKLVTTATSSIDTLRMMVCVQAHAAEHAFVGHCMGEYGFFGRIAGAVLGNHWTYAALDEASAVLQGMPTVESLERKYRIMRHSIGCDLYALIGDPVDASIGHVFHNGRFAVFQQPAVYLKIRLHISELEAFFEVIKPLPFRGVSVTMPLKQAVVPYVNVLGESLAVNTLTRRSGVWEGENTDGAGAVQTILTQHTLAGKHVWVLGCGGAGMAIIQALIAQGAKVTVLNRTYHSHLKTLPVTFCHWEDALDWKTQIVEGVVNALPQSVMPDATIQSVIVALLHHQPWVLDSNYPTADQRLAQCCAEADCDYLSGEQFFEQQAIAQSEMWLSIEDNPA